MLSCAPLKKRLTKKNHFLSNQTQRTTQHQQRYIVIPERPQGTEGWGEARLARLVTRDSLIGVRRALTPAEVGGG
jgi:L-alanine-DL-glutamate epimerase-like enolase superfamily enzyme